MKFNWTDNPLMRGLTRICDFIILNLLWIVCSIPIITIGASTTALYAVMLKIVKNEEGYIARGFLKAFKENFKESTILWLIVAAVGLLIGMDFRFSGAMSGITQIAFQSIFIFFGFLWLCVVLYVFPLAARYENPIKNTLKNAFLLATAKLPYTLIMVVITGGLVLLTFWNTRTLLFGISLWGMIGVAVVAWLNSMVLRRVFTIFEPDVKKPEA